MDPNMTEQQYMEYITTNRRFKSNTITTLTVIYCIIIVSGAIENLIVLAVVMRKRHMRTARNVFIMNLAISDLLQCIFTAPLTLVEIISLHWPFWEWEFLCKSVGMLQGTSVYASTITIMVIALDRCQVIVYPARRSIEVKETVAVLPIIWAIALIFVSPIFIIKKFQTVPMNSTELPYLLLCGENWSMDYGRAYYSAFSMAVQYIVPIVVITTAYMKISKKLKRRMTLSSNSNNEIERNRRARKTNNLLLSITLIYGIGWLPLNVLNLVTDIYMTISVENFMIIFAICHIMGMSSACTNPFLYGWLNDNFRTEIKEILCCIKRPLRNRSQRNMFTDVKSVRYDCNNHNRVTIDCNGTSMHSEYFNSDDALLKRYMLAQRRSFNTVEEPEVHVKTVVSAEISGFHI